MLRHKYKYMCINDDCNFVVKGSHDSCPKCGSVMLCLGNNPRAPKKTASKAKWRKFRERFLYPVLKRWKSRTDSYN